MKKLFFILLFLLITNVYAKDKIVYNTGIIKLKTITEVHKWGITFDDSFSSGYSIISAIYTTNSDIAEKIKNYKPKTEIKIQDDSIIYVDLSQVRNEFRKSKDVEFLKDSDIRMQFANSVFNQYGLFLKFRPAKLKYLFLETGFSYGYDKLNNSINYGAYSYKHQRYYESYNFKFAAGIQLPILGYTVLVQINNYKYYQFIKNKYIVPVYDSGSYVNRRPSNLMPGKIKYTKSDISISLRYLLILKSFFIVDSGVEYYIMNNNIFENNSNLLLSLGIGYRIIF